MLAAPCHYDGPLLPVAVKRVMDGDTLELADGRRVRLAGINTPELGYDHSPNQPFAREAKIAATEFLDGRAIVVPGTGHDRYGRLIAYVFNPAGESLESHLLDQGLGFQVTMPPDLDYRDCYKAAESSAFQQGRGVWSHEFYRSVPADQVAEGMAGFSRVTGRVESVQDAGDAWWLELRGKVVLQVPARYRHYFPAEWGDTHRGQFIEVRGWLVDRGLSAVKKGRKRWHMVIRHPDSVKVIAP